MLLCAFRPSGPLRHPPASAAVLRLLQLLVPLHVLLLRAPARDPRVSSVQPPSDTDQTQARHLRHRRHQCQSTPLRHCFDTPRHYSDTSDTSDTQTHQGSSVWPMACVSAAHCGAVSLVLYSDPRPTDPSAASGLGSSERSRASRPVSAGLGRSRAVWSGLERSRGPS